MGRLTAELQFCLGISSIILSLGSAWSLGTGGWVKISVAGANISVNQKLEAVEKITADLTDTATQLKAEPGVSSLKIEAIEQELATVNSSINRTGNSVERELDKLIENNEF